MSAAFLRQDNKPLFPDILWNRPLNRAQGGRILIVGGQKNGFSECQAIFQMCIAAGAGECQIALPDSLAKTVGPLGIGTFLPSSASGSLGSAALGELLHLASDYDAIIIAGNLTNNAETTVLIESFIDKYSGPLIIGQEVLDMLKLQPQKISQRERTLIVCEAITFFKWANTLEIPFPGGNWDNLPVKLEAAQKILQVGKADYGIYNGQIFIPSPEKPSTTNMPASLKKLPSAPIGVLAVFWLQNPAKVFEGLTTGAFLLAQSLSTSESGLTYTILAKNMAAELEKADF